MHSSKLRGTDFEICLNNQPISHTEFFHGFSNLTRVGIITPNGIDGVGASALIMAHVTAFYDCYRAQGGDFFAYPSYFTFQHNRPLASYTMLDIWPQHKDVLVENNPVELLNAINDRAINILLIPDKESTHRSFERSQIEAALRNITTCYLYSADGNVKNANLEVTAHSQRVIKWTGMIFSDHEKQPTPQFVDQKTKWEALHGTAQSLRQSFRQISVDEALTRL